MKKFALALIAPLMIGLAPPAQASTNIAVCAQNGARGAGVATTVTSCPFAISVFNSYVGNYATPAYSPVTGLTYVMHCTSGWEITMQAWPWRQSNAIRCQGGNNAEVWLW